jgi:hypothetical protein
MPSILLRRPALCVIDFALRHELASFPSAAHSKKNPAIHVFIGKIPKKSLYDAEISIAEEGGQE